MAGYKTTVKNDVPVSFHTFDLDSDIGHGGQIIDEMNSNKNPMFTVGDNYSLEYMSLNPIETSDQHSIRVAEVSEPNGDYSPIYANIPHNSDYNMEEFSIEFIAKKKQPSRSANGSAWRYQHIYSPLVKKGSKIYIYYNDLYNQTDTLKATIGGLTVTHNESTSWPRRNVVNHYVLTYGTEQVDVNEYKITLRMYLNGRNISTSSANYFDSPPNVITGEQWFLFGDGGNDPLTDYTTEDLQFDQFAIYNYVLTNEQVSNHYRKTKTYRELIKTDKPTYYWRFNDTSLLNDTIYNVVGGINGTYYNSHVKGDPGPEYIKDSMSTYFNNGGAGYFFNDGGNYNNYVPMLYTNGSYSVEFWFQIDQNHKGLIFTSHEDKPNNRGVTVYANSKFENETTGVIQCNETIKYQLHSPDGENYTDGKWHHLVFKRSGTTLYMNIDGERVDEMIAPLLGTNGDPGGIHVMSLDPYVLTTDGSLSELAIYQYAIQDMQINSHYHFSTRHKIFGFTLLEGQGVPSKVRFYDNITGELIGETISDTTGEYTFYTYSNKKLDIVALLPDNITTRYRIHAPIVPAEFDDPHL